MSATVETGMGSERSAGERVLSRVRAGSAVCTLVCLAVNALAIAPRPLAAGVAGVLCAVVWLTCELKAAPTVRADRPGRGGVGFVVGARFFPLLLAWVSLTAVCYAWIAHARPVHMGFDLAFLTQPVTMNKSGAWMRSSIEREMNFLIQHWEPAWFSTTLLSYAMSGRAAVVLWQGIGFVIGFIGAWRLCHRIVPNILWARLCVLVYVTGWAITNPLYSDAHAPMFGSLALFPFVFDALLRQQFWRASLLLLGMAQFGEIFFAVIPAYLCYMLVARRATLARLALSALLVCAGYALLMAYQRHFGAWFSGDPNLSSFMARYESIGGDSMGILRTALTAPHKILLQFVSAEKVTTGLLALLFFGPFPFLAFRNKAHFKLAACVLVGILPYVLKVGLADSDFTVHRGRHYIAEFGPQWWFLGVLGIQWLVGRSSAGAPTDKPPPLDRLLARPRAVLAFFMLIVLFNTSVWRQSPLLAVRYLVAPEALASDTVRTLIASVPQEGGVAFFGTEWLCPIGAERMWLLCEAVPERVLRAMPLDLIVAGDAAAHELEAVLRTLPEDVAHRPVLEAFVSADRASRMRVLGWERVYVGRQATSYNLRKFKSVEIWARTPPVNTEESDGKR